MVQQLDFAILDWIQSHLRCAFLDALMPKVTLLAEYGIVLILLGMALLCIKKYRAQFLFHDFSRQKHRKYGSPEDRKVARVHIHYVLPFAIGY